MPIKTPIILFLLSVVGDGLADVSLPKFAARNYPAPQLSGYHVGYAYPTGSIRQKDLHYRYPGTSDFSSYSPKPVQSAKVQSLDVGSGSGPLTSGQETWNPSSDWNGTHLRYPSGFFRSGYYQDPVEGSHSAFQYQHARPLGHTGYLLYKKPLLYYGKGKIVKGQEKPKQKKPQYLHYAGPTGFKKTVYPRVYTPYAVHKYPIKKNPHPYYRRYYQTQYVVPSADMFLNKVKNVYAYGDESSTVTVPSVTTERVRSAEGSDYSVTSEDHVNSNDTHPDHSGIYSSYHGTHQGMEQTTEEASTYGGTSIRGYYGDRILSNGQVPTQSADKGPRHRFYLTRSEPEDDDDLETIFG